MQDPATHAAELPLDPSAPSRRTSPVARMLSAPGHRRCFLALLVIELSVTSLAVAATPSLVGVAALWLLGTAGWTLVEYVLHRFAFHLPHEHVLAMLGARQHLEHHRTPERAPITKPLRLTLPVILVAACTAALLGAWGLALAGGLIFGYLVYEVVHVAAHVLRDDHPLPGLQRWHLAHHAEPRRRFGITSPLWDLFLRTR